MVSILIADDQPENMRMIKQMLQLLGHNYHFLQAPDGEVACRLAEKKMPDLILMDWEMPKMDGITAVKYLKKTASTQDIPIIMCTARSSSTDLEMALKAGAMDYIKKPMEKIELQARVQSALLISSSLKEIKRKNDSLNELNQEKDGLMSMVAHDLKSPLNKIKGFLSLMPLVGELNEEQLEYKQHMENVIEEGSLLIRDLLDMHAFDHQDVPLKLSEVDSAFFLEDWLKEYASEFERKEQVLQTAFAEGAVLQTEKESLKRILDNLLTNAIKFTGKGKSIWVSSEKVHNWIFFSIKDEGPGISERDQKKMFRKFQKLSAMPTDGESSNGLGLAIIKSLTEKLRGAIRVKSELGKGTEFIVELPVKP